MDAFKIWLSTNEENIHFEKITQDIMSSLIAILVILSCCWLVSLMVKEKDWNT